MPTYPRYTSFRQDELEARLRELDREGRLGPALPTRTAAGNGGGNAAATRGRGRLIKSHSCPVRFPDGQEGDCAYTRGGPAWHLFRFTHGMGNASTSLPTQHLTERLGNDTASIEAAARRLAEAAYRAAVLRERREYFQRASEGGGRRRRPERCQMKAQRAKALAGKYALCRRVGERLLPVSAAFELLEVANEAWREQADPNLVVACCNRLDRCWELPRFNPLYAQCDPRSRKPAAATVRTAGTALEATGAACKAAGEDDWEYLPGPDQSEDEEDGDAFGACSGPNDRDEEEGP